MKVEIWSDVVCPWCYIGKRRFEKALAQFSHTDDVEVTYRAFELDPSQPKGRTENTAQMLARKYGMPVAQAKTMQTRVEQTAAGEGLEYHLDRTLSGNTVDAHRVLLLAKESGKQDAMVERFYRAYFTEGQSLFDHQSLVRLAVEAGLDAEEVRRVLATDAYADEVEADEREAHALGATGVPFFVVDGRYGVSGAQPSELFAQVLDRAWAERQAQPQVTQVAGDGGAICEDDCCAVPTEPAG
jgi:predicted DsbA family dithiol-disulfide isomerase